MNHRTIILTIISLCFSGLSYAQSVTAGGNFMMGGTLGFSTASSSVEIQNSGNSISNEGTRATQFNISPRIGYFVSDNFVIGIGMFTSIKKKKRSKMKTARSPPEKIYKKKSSTNFRKSKNNCHQKAVNESNFGISHHRSTKCTGLQSLHRAKHPRS